MSTGAAIHLFEQTVAGVYAVGLDSQVLYVNAHLADILGYLPEEVIGHSFFDFVDDEDLAVRRATFARISSGEVTTLQNVGVFKRRDGDVRDILTESTLAEYDGVPAIIGIGTDVTERYRAQHDLQRANRALQTLSGANSAMMRAGTELELLQDMCDVAFATGNYQLAWAGIADPDRSVRPVANAGAGAEILDQALIRWDDSPGGNGPTGLAIRTAMPVVMRELEGDARLEPWLEFYHANGHRAIASLPLKNASGVFGSLTLSSRDPRAFDAEELDLLSQLAEDISYGIAALRNRAALFDAEERYREHSARLEALWRIANNPRLSGDELWLAMLSEAAAAIRPGFPYFGALFRIQGGEFAVAAVAETAEYAATQHGFGFEVGMRAPLSGTALETITERGVGTYTWDDLRTAFDTPLIQRFGWRSSICTTFELRAETYMLWFASTEQTGTWQPLDRAYAEVVASFFSNQAQLRWQFERIQYQQTHDVLTNVLNRSHFRAQARMASVTDGTFAVITLNLNDFSDVNETYGSMIGDALLVEVAAGLFERAAQGEIVGRLGGDVFAIYVPAPRSTDFVRQRAIHFAERFRNPFSTGDREGKEFIALTASFGIAVAPQHGTTVDAAVSHANAALTAAKARGRGIVLVYEPGMEGDAEHTVLLRNELVEALAREQFELYFQPHQNLVTGATSGCEALIRWHHPVRGLILPGQFIPFAERAGLIAEIDTWVMRSALASARELAALRPGHRLYFNLSGRQAGDPALISTFKAFAADGFPMESVGIEVTETDTMRDFEATRTVCLALRELGVRVAIDDFGTGYSSLWSLKRLPVDVIKIDRSFVSGILIDRHDEAIVETIIRMTKLFDCKVLAEGVEQGGELDWLRRHACDYAQGFLVAHPMPMPEFKVWLSATA